MRTVTSDTDAAWRARLKGGTERRPMARVTIQAPLPAPILTQYDVTRPGLTAGAEVSVHGEFASMLFGQSHVPAELPNVKSVTWNRAVSQDVATVDLELWNTEALPLGQAPEGPYEFDRPGYFSFARGDAASNALWGYSSNGWRDRIVPDAVLRVFEGYGFDRDLIPENDPHLYLTGVWLIDDVDYGADGTIRIRGRDPGRELVEQIYFPPVVPQAEYPMVWDHMHSVANPDVVTSSVTPTGWKRPAWVTDSSQAYIGVGIWDGDAAYVEDNGSVRGHHGRHAFDASKSTYWMSVGDNPGWTSAYEYVEGRMPSTDVASVRVKPWGGPYTVYVSVFADGEWKGRHNVPYRAQMIDTNADIPYVTQAHVGKNKETVISLPRVFSSVTKIRLTFAGLYDSGVGTYQYRAGAYMIEYSGSVPATTTTSGGSHQEGSYSDLINIVQWILAWGGFHWPPAPINFQTDSDSSVITYTDTGASILPVGSVWGDFEATGVPAGNDTAEQVIDFASWDKKPLADAISAIREIVQYVSWVDEWGGYVFRSPNIWGLGNYVSLADGGPLGVTIAERNSARTTDVLLIDENETLINFTLSLTSRDRRDFIFVANADASFAAGAAGYNPFPSGTRRVAGFTDQAFANVTEAQIMADLISLRLLFKYTTATLTVPGNPAIQIDDQIDIRERLTAHASRHYIQSITSTLDNSTGKWTYQLTTNWLGSPDNFPANWAYNPLQLKAETQAFLTTIGKLG